ncbi:NAD(P)-binding protein [Ophiobolus disseminans]|uniref:NAD(P)-binding protein n=1 Tax=Ophiobolus disseminans TaxID=1469910 RepID=A0A6A7A628_9PLEO|nr:NAD(P)-binding protein [Ophiobolus disseminans]
MSPNSEKQIILITGATAGIGFDTAVLLASSSPSNHVIMGARNATKAEAKVKEVQAKNPKGTVSWIELDVDSDASIEAAAKKLEQDFGRIHILINNAGVCPEPASGSPDTSREFLRATFETNVYGPTLLTQALLPLIKASKSAKVINVTSGLGSISMFNADLDASSVLHYFKDVQGIGYRMSKSALNMLSAWQQYQLRDTAVKVWAYCPGYVVTDLGGDREEREKMGLESSETSAQGILDIVEGKRDAEKGGFVTKRGGSYPW